MIYLGQTMICWIILILGSSNLLFHRERWETGMEVFTREVHDNESVMFWFAGSSVENELLSNWTRSSLPIGNWRIETDLGRSRNTADNLGYFLDKMGKSLDYNTTRLAIVSHSWHLPRVRRIWDKMSSKSIPVYYRSYTSENNFRSETVQARWWERVHVWNVSRDVQETLRRIENDWKN